MLGLDPSISCRRFSGLRFASPENDGRDASALGEFGLAGTGRRSSDFSAIGTASGATVAPGRMRCRPLTTMRSPGFSPSVTMRSPSLVAPSVTSRQAALLSAPTTKTNFLFWSVPTARSLMTSAGSERAWPICTRTNWPGSSLPSGLSSTARTRTVPLAASTALSTKRSLPVKVAASLAAVASFTGICSSARSFSGRRRQRVEHGALVGVEAGIDRIDRDQRRQQRARRLRLRRGCRP